jgi:kynurenine formamidase
LIGFDLLMQAIAAQRVEIRPGDFLMLHTGYGDALMSMGRKPDEDVLHKTGAALDGSDTRLLDWIDRSGIKALIADNQAVESFDPELAATGPNGLLPLHDRCLFKLGIQLGELWWLGDLARHLDSVGRHTLLLIAPPLRLPGAVGSPVTPIATV